MRIIRFSHCEFINREEGSKFLVIAFWYFPTRVVVRWWHFKVAFWSCRISHPASNSYENLALPFKSGIIMIITIKRRSTGHTWFNMIYCGTKCSEFSFWASFEPVSKLSHIQTLYLQLSFCFSSHKTIAYFYHNCGQTHSDLSCAFKLIHNTSYSLTWCHLLNSATSKIRSSVTNSTK